ncbi:MAG: host attachment family protein [Allosphingosinicella sp.]
MRIPTGTHVLVTDGRKMLLFRNDGDADYPNLHVIAEEEQPDLPDREQKSDAPGHVSSFGTGRSSAYDEADFHELGEALFATRAAERLNRQAEAGDFEKLVIVADPRTLGELRRHYSKPLQERLLAEIGKDLVKHPVPDIERILSRA